MVQYASLLPALTALQHGSKTIHATMLHDEERFPVPRVLSLCGVATYGEPGTAEINCKRCLRIMDRRTTALSDIQQRERRMHEQIASAFREVVNRRIGDITPRAAWRQEAQRFIGTIHREAYTAQGMNEYGERMVFVQNPDEDHAFLWHSDDLLRDEALIVVDGKVQPDIITNQGERMFIASCWENSEPWR